MKVFCMIDGLSRCRGCGSWDLGWGQGQGRGDHGKFVDGFVCFDELLVIQKAKLWC